MPLERRASQVRQHMEVQREKVHGCLKGRHRDQSSIQDVALTSSLLAPENHPAITGLFLGTSCDHRENMAKRNPV